MRVISGTLRGRRLAAVKGSATRPTSDRTREAVFNILGTAVNDRRVMDLYAGTGALAIEALSRGARRALLVDNARSALATIRKNVAACDLNAVITLRHWDLRRRPTFLAEFTRGFDLVFMDPPYGQDLICRTLDHLDALGALMDAAVVVAEHHVADQLTGFSDRFRLEDQRRYGKTLVSFFEYML